MIDYINDLIMSLRRQIITLVILVWFLLKIASLYYKSLVAWGRASDNITAIQIIEFIEYDCVALSGVVLP